MTNAGAAFPIFIVDDDDAVRESLRLLLGLIYDHVEDFGSSVAFMDAVEDIRHGCLILDIHMPELTGIDVVRELARRSIRLPTILMTGRADSNLRAQAHMHGVLAVLDKPIDHDALLEAIDRARVVLNG
jgi:two-component system, LuxR family, response regulator FixJ